MSLNLSGMLLNHLIFRWHQSLFPWPSKCLLSQIYFANPWIYHYRPACSLSTLDQSARLTNLSLATSQESFGEKTALWNVMEEGKTWVAALWPWPQLWASEKWQALVCPAPVGGQGLAELTKVYSKYYLLREFSNSYFSLLCLMAFGFYSCKLPEAD